MPRTKKATEDTGVQDAPVTTDDLLAWWADRCPDRVGHTVLTATGACSDLTYGEWHRAVRAVSAGLSRHGVTAGSFVGLAFGRGQVHDLATCLVAVHRLGAAAVLLPADENADGRTALAALCPLACVVVSEPDESWPVPVLTVPALRATPGPAPAAAHRDTPATALVVFTSGTTGTPKAVAIQYADLMARAPRRPSELDTHPAAGSVHLNAYQPSTAAGQWVALAPLLLGVHMITAAELTPTAMIDVIRRYRVDEVAMVPAMAAVLGRTPLERAEDTASVRRASIGTARCPAAVLERMARLFPHAAIRVEYASTESGFAGTGYTYGADVAPDAVGWPNQGTDVRVTDDLGVAVPTGRHGRVELRIPDGLPPRSYLGDPVATATTFRGPWVRMADIGYLDDDGCLHLVGRTQDFVNVSGRKVACAEVERALEAHPGVLEAAALAVPDEMLGEELAVAVLAEAGIGADDVRRFATECLPAHAVPGRVVVLDELPRTRNGKVSKEELPALFTTRADDAPSGDVEERLSRIVSSALGIASADRACSLLELGATSLHMLRIYFALVAELGTDFDINVLFLGDSLAQIARDVAAATGRTTTSSPQRDA